MFAVIRTGGKQYRVAPNDIIEIEKIAGAPGDIVELGEVLLLDGDGGPKTGSPTLPGASVAAEVLEQKRGEKILVFKKKRRKNYRRKNGHRQALTTLRITEILTDGKKPSKTRAERPEPKTKPESKGEAKETAAEKRPAKKAPPAKKEPAKKAPPAKKPATKKAAPAKKPATKSQAAKPKKS